MRRRVGLAGLILAATLAAGPGLAAPPDSSPRPQPRPAVPAAPQSDAAPAPVAEAVVPHPAPRPGTPQPSAAPAPDAGPGPAGVAPEVSLRPLARPQAAPAQTAAAKPGTRGALCGDSAIKGTVLAPITSRVQGCGVAEPVSVEFVAGVRLNPPATLDCTTAEALKTWINKGLQPAFAPRKVVELVIFGSYMCRSRNNVRGARISEHGSGKAIDVAGFVLDTGQTLTVLGNYNATIRKAQRAACGPFGTTLGPGSDGYHENHIHLDTASYRSGPYCH